MRQIPGYFHTVLRRHDDIGRPRSARVAAAYQARERVRHGRHTFDFRQRRDLEAAELLLPERAASLSRPALWSLADAIERFPDGVVARRIVLSLPSRLPLHDRWEMVRAFCLSHFVRRGMAVDVAMHNVGRPQGRTCRPHAHLLLTVRRLENRRFEESMEMAWADAELHKRAAAQWRSLTASFGKSASGQKKSLET